MYSLAENFLASWHHDYARYFRHRSMIFPLIDQCTRPSISDIRKREGIIRGHSIRVNLHHMRYECIALSLGCSGFAMTPLRLFLLVLPVVVTFFSSPTSHTRITSMYSKYYFPKTLWWREARGGMGSPSPPQLASLPLITKKSNTQSWMYLLPLPHPAPFPLWAWTNKPGLVLGAWRDAQAKRLPGNRRGCAFGPNYSGQTPSIAAATPPSELVPPLLKEKKLPLLHSLKFSVTVLRARSVCLWRWMSDRPGSLLFRPCWGLHIMKGTWGEQEKREEEG